MRFLRPPEVDVLHASSAAFSRLSFRAGIPLAEDAPLPSLRANRLRLANHTAPGQTEDFVAAFARLVARITTGRQEPGAPDRGGAGRAASDRHDPRRGGRHRPANGPASPGRPRPGRRPIARRGPLRQSWRRFGDGR